MGMRSQGPAQSSRAWGEEQAQDSCADGEPRQGASVTWVMHGGGGDLSPVFTQEET